MNKIFKKSFAALCTAAVLLTVSCSFNNPFAKTDLKEKELSSVSINGIKNFSMGYPGVAEPVHIVPWISAYTLEKYEVTYELWYTVYQWAIVNGYTFANAGMEGSAGSIGLVPTEAKLEPVTAVNWRDTIVWCNAYSQMSGLTPVYYTDAGFTEVLKSSYDINYEFSINTTAGSFDNPYVNWTAKGYRLPTEAEWEYAARYINSTAFTPGTYASGAVTDYTNEIETRIVAVYWKGDGTDKTLNIGSKDKNSLGLYDMSGNVWEWCWDWYGPYSMTSPYTDADPKGAVNGTGRIIRGGSWYFMSDFCQVSRRGYGSGYGAYGAHPFLMDGSVGFRLARTN